LPSSPSKPWRRKLPPPNPPPPLPEFAGGSPEDIADELLHYPIYLFLAGDQGEGHPPSFFIFFPKYSMDELGSIYSNAALRQQAAHCSCSTCHR
jgi:hypothetical protein